MTKKTLVLKDVAEKVLFLRLLKNAPAFVPQSEDFAQAARCKLSTVKSRPRGRTEILCRERFETVPYRYPLQQACPVLDTEKDEGWHRDE